MGTKGRPFYRIVAAPTSAGRDGRFVEQLGHYDPLQEPSLVKVDKDRVLHWLKSGASPSDTLIRLLKKEGIWEDFETGKPEKKPRRKPVQARVKKEKPVKEKKRKPAPAAEESTEEPATETAADEAAAAEESAAEAPVSEETVTETAADEAATEPEAPAAEDAPAEEEPAQ
jgi:small subunit ribosomal protein S16